MENFWRNFTLVSCAFNIGLVVFDYFIFDLFLPWNLAVGLGVLVVLYSLEWHWKREDRKWDQLMKGFDNA